MCIMMMAYQFLVYLNNVNLLRSRLTTGVESLIGTMFTYYAMRDKSHSEDMMFQYAQNIEAEEYMEMLREEKFDLKNKAYRPNAHLLYIVMHYNNGNI